MRSLLLLTALCSCLAGLSQYKNDNVLFKTVFIEDLCQQLKANPNAVLLDVRSKGEYEDTSAFYGLNIGRLKNTVHLDINEMNTRWRELLPYKDKTMYVMCSHSQRSRRVSKMLADSGFTNIVNVNGGLTTYNLLSAVNDVCKDRLYETHNKYKLVSPLGLCDFMAKNKDVFVVDVRSDSAFRGIHTDERQNMLGKMNGAVNIPLATLRTSTDGVPKGKKILVVDNFGSDASLAASLLAANGYTDVNVLFNGLDMLATLPKEQAGCAGKLVARTAKYQLLPADDFDALMTKNKSVVIVDARPAEEFNNQSKQAFRNIGHIRNAINIPGPEIEQRSAELGDRSRPVVLYHFSSGASDVFAAARKLTELGYQNVYVLSGGIFNLRWRAANFKGKSHLNDHVVNIPAENL
jgi:rhodanese-related sulfurtransferase